jgi:hypothetical protein
MRGVLPLATPPLIQVRSQVHTRTVELGDEECVHAYLNDSISNRGFYVLQPHCAYTILHSTLVSSSLSCIQPRILISHPHYRSQYDIQRPFLPQIIDPLIRPVRTIWRQLQVEIPEDSCQNLAHFGICQTFPHNQRLILSYFSQG